MNTSTPSNIFLLKRSIDLSLLRQGFHIPPEFHALVYAALGRELHHGEGCDIQLMVEGKVLRLFVTLKRFRQWVSLGEKVAVRMENGRE